MDNESYNDALDFLELYDGNIDQAIVALRTAKQTLLSQKAAAPKIDGPLLIELNGVSKTYSLGRQKVEALKNVSMKVHQGEFIAITGASGSGKSTLLQLIGGLDKPTAGTITIDGQNIGKLSDRNLSKFRNKTVGFVFQFFYLQPFLRLDTNLEIPGMFARTPKNERLTKVKTLATAVALDDRLKHYPRELSGGQMQRAAIARALLNNPKVILADEPTGNLDSENGRAIISLFEQVRKDFGTTVVVVTHDKSIAARADRRILVEDGVVT